MKRLRELFSSSSSQPKQQSEPGAVKPNIFSRLFKWMSGGGSSQPQQQSATQEAEPGSQPKGSNINLEVLKERKTDPKVEKFQKLMNANGLRLDNEDANKLYDAYMAMKQNGHYGVPLPGNDKREMPKGMGDEIMKHANAFARVGGIAEFIRKVVSPMSKQEEAEKHHEKLLDKVGSIDISRAQENWQKNATKIVNNLFSGALTSEHRKQVDRLAAGQAFVNFHPAPNNDDLRDLCERYADVIKECGGIDQFFEEHVRPLDEKKANFLCAQSKLALAAQDLANIPENATPQQVEEIAAKYADELGSLNYVQYLQDQVAPLNPNSYEILIRDDMQAAANRGMLYAAPGYEEPSDIVLNQPEGEQQPAPVDPGQDKEVVMPDTPGGPEQVPEVQTPGGPDDNYQNLNLVQPGEDGGGHYQNLSIVNAVSDFLEAGDTSKFPTPDDLQGLLLEHADAVNSAGGYDEFLEKHIKPEDVNKAHLWSMPQFVSTAKEFLNALGQEGEKGMDQAPPQEGQGPDDSALPVSQETPRGNGPVTPKG